MVAGPKYPNQQLRSVSLETYFAGTLRGLAAMAEVQERVRDRFPNLYVPNAMIGEALALRPFQLRDVTNTRSLALAINQVTFVAFRPYPGFDDFVVEALPLINGALKAFSVDELTRIVFRYENELAIPHQGGATLGALTSTFPLIQPEVFRGRLYRQLDSTVEVAWAENTNGNELHGAEGFRSQVEQGPWGQILRLHIHATVENVQAVALDNAARAAHEHANGIFESIISDDFRNFLKRSDDAPISNP